MTAISKQGGNVKVFDNVTTNQTSPDFLFKGGLLQVDIAGVLDGADVFTFYYGVNNVPVELRNLSWLASDQDQLTLGADGGIVELARGTKVFFKIENAGSSTNISLNAFPIIEVSI